MLNVVEHCSPGFFSSLQIHKTKSCHVTENLQGSPWCHIVKLTDCYEALSLASINAQKKHFLTENFPT